MYFVSTVLNVKGSPVPPGEDNRTTGIGTFTQRGECAFLISVADGCGGSGGTVYAEAQNWTGARIASTEVSLELGRWFSKSDVGALSTKEQANSLQTLLYKRLKELSENLPGIQFRGGMIKMLPTTVTAITAAPTDEKHILLRYFWAGNTRGYYFGSTGLRQITWDDTVGDLDPFEDLQKDGILSNVANATKPFVIHFRELTTAEPCIVFAASDGCFSSFLSPLELEEKLLNTLMQANTPVEWEHLLDGAIGRIAGDDYTMQIAVLGFQTFEAIKMAFTPRWKAFCEHYQQRLEACRNLSAEDPNLKIVLQNLWNEYKADFLREVDKWRVKQ